MQACHIHGIDLFGRIYKPRPMGADSLLLPVSILIRSGCFSHPPAPLHGSSAHVSYAPMKRILSWYIVREICSLFFLGLSVFTLVLLMGRLIKLTDLVIGRGVPFVDVARMIFYLMPSFLVFTIPMAFLLAVLLAFSRLSADNEVTVMKACGISLVQLMPPVVLLGLVMSLAGLYVGVVGVPWGNQSFTSMSLSVLQQNVAATIREKVFWDDVPGIVLYTEHYDEERHTLAGVVIYDGRDASRPLTIFAAEGNIGGSPNPRDLRLTLRNGSIHVRGKAREYRLINYGEYVMTITTPGADSGFSRNPRDMSDGELRRLIVRSDTPRNIALKMASELHGRYALPFASLVFAVVAVPLGLQNRRSAKSAGLSISIGVLLLYYIILSVMGSLAERGVIPALLAMWIPNLVFLGFGWNLLRMVSLEQKIFMPTPAALLGLIRKGH